MKEKETTTKFEQVFSKQLWDEKGLQERERVITHFCQIRLGPCQSTCAPPSLVSALNVCVNKKKKDWTRFAFSAQIGTEFTRSKWNKGGPGNEDHLLSDTILIVPLTRWNSVPATHLVDQTPPQVRDQNFFTLFSFGCPKTWHKKEGKEKRDGTRLSHFWRALSQS